MRANLSLIAALFLTMVSIGNFGFYAGRNLGLASVSPDDFMEIEVFVNDSKYGEDPILEIKRDIKQIFRAKWTVEVNASQGTFTCSASDSNIYTPDSTIPNKPTLFDFWMFARGDPTRLCVSNRYPLPIGCYFLDTFWEANNFDGDFVIIFNRSNEFCVREV